MILREYIQTDYFEETEYDNMLKLIHSQQTQLIRCGYCAMAQPIIDIDGSTAQEWIWCPKLDRQRHVTSFCSEAISKENI